MPINRMIVFKNMWSDQSEASLDCDIMQIQSDHWIPLAGFHLWPFTQIKLNKDT